jgi:hypothetical protein
LLHRLGYSLQANAKVTEDAQHPDRDGQIAYLNDTAASFIAPVEHDYEQLPQVWRISSSTSRSARLHRQHAAYIHNPLSMGGDKRLGFIHLHRDNLRVLAAVRCSYKYPQSVDACTAR